MDTLVSQCWYGDKAEETCTEINTLLTELDRRLSLYDEDSEIAMINAAAGETRVPISEELADLLARSLSICEDSGGLFDITIAPLSTLWNITGEDPKVPTEAEIKEAQRLVDYRKLELSDAPSAYLEESGMMLDLGAVAKGLAAEMAGEIAKKNEVSGWISIGGNMFVLGENPDGSEIRIGLRDPNGDANTYFATVEMSNLTMATTATYERYFEQDGVRYHHILDPKTGYPSDSDLISVTVMSEDGVLADGLSTSIFLQGTEGLSRYLDREDCLVLAIDKDNTVYTSAGFKERMKPVDNSGYTFK